MRILESNILLMSCLCFMIMLLVFANDVSAQITVSSVQALRNNSNLNNTTIVLAAGDYWIDGDHIGNPTESEPIFLELSGSNNTYDLSNANIYLDTRKLDGFGRNLGHGSTVYPIKISGNDNTVMGLTLIGVDVDVDTDPNAQRHADWGTNYVQMTGVGNGLINAFIETRGSFPYGLSDAFGKGSSQGIQPYISHRKACGVQVWAATDAYFDNLHIDMNTYGHGFFVQGGSVNTTLVNSSVTGEQFPSSNVIEHPLYQQYGHTYYGNPIPENIMMSGSEDGVRLYSNGSNGFTVDNVIVTDMRTGFAMTHGSGSISISNSETYGAESGFDIGRNTTITNCKADMVNGPVLWFPASNASNNMVDIEIVGEAPVGVDWSAAYLNGSGMDVTLSTNLASGTLPQDSVVRLGQKFFEDWRNSNSPTGPDDGADDFINSMFTNNTDQLVVMGDEVSNNLGGSESPVMSNGKENYYDGVTLVAAGQRLVLTHNSGLGNGGSASAGTLDVNGTIVESLATLQLSAGISVVDEQLTISGVGTDGTGALYSDGTSNGSTRFGDSGSSNESTIHLAGDAAIGVGVAGNELQVGSITGSGNLTKLGAGRLVIAKASSFSGSFVLDAGEAVARSDVFGGNVFVQPGTTLTQIGDSINSFNGNALISGTLDVNGRTDDSNLSMTTGRLIGDGEILLSNPSAGASAALNLNAFEGQSGFGGTITGAVSVIKSGGATQVLSGNNNYTGVTSITGGTLVVDGDHSGGGDYQVFNTGALAGSGSIDANVLIGGGSIEPGGESVGSLTLAEVNMLNGSLQIQLSGNVAGVEYDQLITDSLTINGSLMVESLDGFQPAANDSFLIVAVNDSLSGVFVGLPEGATVTTIGNVDLVLSYNGGDGNDVVLNASATTILYGDVNLDGVVTLLDVAPFVSHLAAGTFQAEADCNMDGSVNLLDVESFIQLVGG